MSISRTLLFITTVLSIVLLYCLHSTRVAIAQVATATSTATALPTTIISITASADTYVQNNAVTTNYGTANQLRVRSSGPTNNSYLRFVVTGVTGVVQRARLRLYVADASPSAGSVYTASNNYLNTATAWVETGVNWNNAPAIGSVALSSVATANLNTWVEFDVTALVKGNGTYNLAIRNNSTNPVYYNSKEATTNRPALVLQVVNSATATPTSTPTSTPTFTPVPPTSTPTLTRVPPTSTATATPTSSGSAISVNVIADTYVDSTAATTNYGNANQLRVRSSRPTNNSYLRFVVTSVTGGVQSAKIRLYVVDASPSAGSIYTVSNNYLNTATPWLETGMNWNNAPAIIGAALSTVGAANLNTWVEFDVSAAVKGNGTFTFAILNNSTNPAYYNSKEAATNRPVLVLQVSNNATATPTSTATNTATNTPTATAVVPTSTSTNTPVPTSTATNTPTATAVVLTSTSTNTPVPTSTATNTATNTPTATAVVLTSTSTNTPVPTSTATNTATNTPTATAVVPTSTSTNTPLPTDTATNTATNTPTTTAVAPTSTSTNTPVPTSTATNTATNTPTATAVAPTSTSTNTPVPTSTATNTATNTPTTTAVVPTSTSTNTPVPTDTATNTATNTPSTTAVVPTSTSTNTPVPTDTATATTVAPTVTLTSTPVPTTTSTETVVPPIDTATFTPVPPTSTATDTVAPATETSTDTPIPPTNTTLPPTGTETSTPVPTNTETATIVPATDTTTSTPTPISTATATVVPTNTATDTPNATATATSTSTSTPVVLKTPYASAPLCPTHDLTVWHSLWNPVLGCHYDHFHGVDPNSMANYVISGTTITYGPAGALYGGQSIGYSFETPNENAIKHRGYHIQAAIQVPCEQNNFNYIKNPKPGCIRSFRVQVHNDTALVEGVTRFHSMFTEAELCTRAGVCGLWQGGGARNDTGEAHIPYKNTCVNVPGSNRPPCPTDPAEWAYILNIPPYWAFTRLEDAQWNLDNDYLCFDGPPYCWNQSSNRSVWELVSSDSPIASRYGEANLLVGMNWRTHAASAAYNSTMGMFQYVCPNSDCVAVGDGVFLYTLIIRVPSFLDLDGNGRVESYNGYTDPAGRVDTVNRCSAPSTDCVPLRIQNVAVGTYIYDMTEPFLPGVRVWGDGVVTDGVRRFDITPADYRCPNDPSKRCSWVTLPQNVQLHKH